MLNLTNLPDLALHMRLITADELEGALRNENSSVIALEKLAIIYEAVIHHLHERREFM